MRGPAWDPLARRGNPGLLAPGPRGHERARTAGPCTGTRVSRCACERARLRGPRLRGAFYGRIVVEHRGELRALVGIEVGGDEVAHAGALRRRDRVAFFTPDPDLGGADGPRREVRPADLGHLLRVVNEDAQATLATSRADHVLDDRRALRRQEGQDPAAHEVGAGSLEVSGRDGHAHVLLEAAHFPGVVRLGREGMGVLRHELGQQIGSDARASIRSGGLQSSRAAPPCNRDGRSRRERHEGAPRRPRGADGRPKGAERAASSRVAAGSLRGHRVADAVAKAAGGRRAHHPLQGVSHGAEELHFFAAGLAAAHVIVDLDQLRRPELPVEIRAEHPRVIATFVSGHATPRFFAR